MLSRVNPSTLLFFVKCFSYSEPLDTEADCYVFRSKVLFLWPKSFLSSARIHERVTGGIAVSSVQLFSHVRIFATPWTAAHQASLSVTNSQSLLKLMTIESVMPSNHLILCHPLFLPPSIFPSIRERFSLFSLFQWVSSLHQVAKVWQFQL